MAGTRCRSCRPQHAQSRSSQTLKGGFGELPIKIPRDRHGSFEPQLIPKHQTRWVGLDDRILSLYARGMVVREGAVRVKAVYLVICITVADEKDLLRLWLAWTEGAKFWLQIVTELCSRSVQDIFIAGFDGLKGFPEAIETVFRTRRLSCALCTWCRTA